VGLAQSTHGLTLFWQWGPGQCLYFWCNGISGAEYLSISLGN
jgi:hypothetical protein